VGPQGAAEQDAMLEVGGAHQSESRRRVSPARMAQAARLKHYRAADMALSPIEDAKLGV
jgi:hypothetical protein